MEVEEYSWKTVIYGLACPCLGMRTSTQFTDDEEERRSRTGIYNSLNIIFDDICKTVKGRVSGGPAVASQRSLRYVFVSRGYKPHQVRRRFCNLARSLFPVDAFLSSRDSYKTFLVNFFLKHY